MQAIILKELKNFVIEEITLPSIAPDEVLIQIKSSGICTNDVRDFNGHCSYSYPRIGGHEYCGIISQMGESVNINRFSIGERVVTYIIDDCKECYYCKNGQENICTDLPKTKTFQNPKGLSGYGGFATYVISKAKDLFVYPDTTSFEKMAFTEPLACVLNSINQTTIHFGDDILIIGGGTMGLLHVMAAKRKGARIILSEPMADRREKALSLGCDIVIDPLNEDVLKKVRELTDGRGANVVFNTTAIAAIAGDAVEMTAPGGTCVMFSSIHPNEAVPVDMGKIHSYQKTITGAVSPTIESYHQAVQMISKNLLDPTALTEALYDYKDFEKAIALAENPKSYKVILTFGEL